MSTSKNLVEELDILVANNIISSAVANNIRAYYETNSPVKKTSWSVVVFSLGIIFITLGLIFLIAYNLEMLGQFPKLFLAIFILITTQLLSYHTVYKNNSLATIIKETILLVYCLLLAGSLILVQQAFVLDGTLHDFLFIWLISVLPLIYLKPFNCPIIIFNFLTFFWLLSMHHTANYWLILPILLSIYPVITTLTKYHLRYLPFICWQVVINIFTACIVIYDKFSPNLSLQFIILIAVLFAQLSNFSSESIFKKPLKFIGYGVSHLFLLISSFNHFGWNAQSITTIPLTTWLMFAAALISNSILSYLLWQKSCLTLPQKLFSAAPIIIFTLSFFSKAIISNHFISWVISLYLLVLYLTYTYFGFRSLTKSNLNLGMLGLIILIMFKVFDYELSFLSKGLVFISLGFIFIFANKILEKKQRGISNE